MRIHRSSCGCKEISAIYGYTRRDRQMLDLYAAWFMPAWQGRRAALSNCWLHPSCMGGATRGGRSIFRMSSCAKTVHLSRLMTWTGASGHATNLPLTREGSFLLEPREGRYGFVPLYIMD